MRITLADLLFRILTRYGVLLLVLGLVIASLLALRGTLKLGARPNLPSMLSLGVLLCSIVGIIVIAPAALRSGARLLQVVRAAFSMPPPISGPFAAASATLELPPLPRTDHAEDQPIRLYLWYPADGAAIKPAATRDPVSCAQLDDVIRMAQAPVPYPLVLFVPGLGGTPTATSFITEHLARHGYVVAGVDDLIRDKPSPAASAADEDIRLRPFDFSSAEGLSTTMARSSLRAERQASRALDALDRLEACIQGSTALQGRIEFKRVGFVGYSFGGTAAAESSFLDPRIAAAVNMDGSLFGRAAEGPVHVPYLMLHSDFDREVLYDPNSPHRYEFMLDQRDLRLVDEQSRRSSSHLFVIRGSFHDSFANPALGVQSLIKWLFLDPYRAHEIIGACLVGFLNAYLRDDPSSLIGPDDPRYPEVRTLNSHS